MDGIEQKLSAEVIAVFPDKVRISVDSIEDFAIAEDNLRVGSYLRIADNDNAVMIAVIENFTIEVSTTQEGEAQRKYILEANPLGIIRDGVFERGGDTLAIPPKKVEPARMAALPPSLRRLCLHKKRSAFPNCLQTTLLLCLWTEINSLISILQLSDQPAQANPTQLRR